MIECHCKFVLMTALMGRYYFNRHMFIGFVGAKLQTTNRVPRPVDRGTATRYGG